MGGIGQVEEGELQEAPKKGQDISERMEAPQYQHDASMDPGQSSGEPMAPETPTRDIYIGTPNSQIIMEDDLGQDQVAPDVRGNNVDMSDGDDEHAPPTSRRRLPKTPEKVAGVIRDRGTPTTPQNSKMRRTTEEIMRDPGMDIDSLDDTELNIVARCILGADITEVFSPERITALCDKFGLVKGSAMDLQNGWDFDQSSHRRLATERIMKEKPVLLIGSPPCTYFSMLQELSKAVQKDNAEWNQRFQANLEKAKRHVKFCCSLYKLQSSSGRYFLHEHPWTARSWKLQCIEEVGNLPGAQKVQTHMCRFGMESHVDKSDGEKGPVMKPTGFLANSWCVAGELDRQCKRDHKHVQLVGGRAAKAAIYPRLLCEAICSGVSQQKMYDANSKVSTNALTSTQLLSFVIKIDAKKSIDEVHRPIGGWPEHWLDKFHESDGGRDMFGEKPQDGQTIWRDEIMGLMVRDGQTSAWDDVSEKYLDPDLVAKARQVELEYFRKLKVYTHVPRSHMKETGGKIIGVRWVDVNKGDDTERNYRSRLVGKEFKTNVDDTLYAPTPPLEALRYILSDAATLRLPGGSNEECRQVMVNDVARAYFYATCTRDVYIELPAEDEAGPNVVGKLNLCLYGTRDAAVNWQETLSGHLVSLGFVRSIAFPCVFAHPVRDLLTLVHGDDYVTSGKAKDLDWMQAELEKAYEIKSSRVGPRAEQQGKVLNRILQFNGNEWSFEADPRHAEDLARFIVGTSGPLVRTAGANGQGPTI